MYKCIKDKNYFQFYTLEGLAPKKPVKPVPTQEDLENEASFKAFSEKLNQYFIEVKGSRSYEEKLENFKHMKAERWELFKEDLFKEAGIVKWPEKLKLQLFDKIYADRHSSGLHEVVDIFLEEADWMEKFLHIWDNCKK